MRGTFPVPRFPAKMRQENAETIAGDMEAVHVEMAWDLLLEVLE